MLYRNKISPRPQTAFSKERLSIIQYLNILKIKMPTFKAKVKQEQNVLYRYNK
uniref:Uncharacterized protein n=1 Tax=Arundo donax TaxID=35708 RepID=A0A0A9CCU2_ARUDO